MIKGIEVIVESSIVIFSTRYKKRSPRGHIVGKIVECDDDDAGLVHVDVSASLIVTWERLVRRLSYRNELSISTPHVFCTVYIIAIGTSNSHIPHNPRME